MRANIQVCLSAVLLASVSACAVAPPSGPSYPAMPAAGESLDQFNQDDYACRQFAVNRSGTQSAQQQQNNQVGTAVVGTAIGAAAGALLGAASGHAGGGAAIGAGVGLLGGSAVAANQTQGGAYSAQQNYDNAYAQCMSAKGDRLTGPYASPEPPPGYAPPPVYAPAGPPPSDAQPAPQGYPPPQ